MDISKKVVFDRKIPINNLPDLPIADGLIDTEILKKWGLTSRTLAELFCKQ